MKLEPRTRSSTARAHAGAALRLAVLLTAASLPGCAHIEPPRPLEITRQASPDPLTGVRTFRLAPFTFTGFTYDGVPEASWQATRSPRQQASWMNDKQSSTEYILQRLPAWQRRGEQIAPLSGSPAPGQFVLALNFDAWDHGGCHATLRIFDAAGALVDEVGIPAQHTSSWYGFADAFRTSLILTTLRALEYVRTRY